MERDPRRLAWRTSPARHLLAGLLLAVAGAFLLVALGLVRIAIDDVMAPSFAGAAIVRLFRLAVDLQGIATFVIFPGLPVERPGFLLTVVLGLALLPLIIALVLIGVHFIVTSIEARILARLRGKVLSAVVEAPPSSREEAATATSIAGDVLARESRILAYAIIAPLQWAIVIGLALAYALIADWRLFAVLGVILLAESVVQARRFARRFDAARARQGEASDAERLLADLLRRVPALRAHGTGRYERERLGRAMVERHRPVSAQERRFAVFDVLAGTGLFFAPLVMLAAAAWLARGGASPSAGTVLAVSLAAILAALAVRELALWHRLIEQSRPLLEELARSLAALQPRERRGGPVALPGSGALVASGLSAYDPASGGRISGVDLDLALPAHIALVGDGDTGPRLLAALVGGQLEPSTGQLTYGGVDLQSVDPVERAHRIAFAGGETILIPGSLRDNLLYGCPAGHTGLDERLAEAVAIAGLDRLIHARGLAGTLDPHREPRLAAAIVESRRAVQTALVAEGLDRYRRSVRSDALQPPRHDRRKPPVRASRSATLSAKTISPRIRSSAPSWKRKT